MAALTDHRNYPWSQGQGRSLWPIAAAQKIYDNAFLGRNGNLARPFQAGDKQLGFAFRSVNVEAHDVDSEVEIITRGVVTVPVTGVTDNATHYGVPVFATSDGDFQVADPGGGAVAWGKIKQVTAAGYAEVAFDLVLG